MIWEYYELDFELTLPFIFFWLCQFVYSWLQSLYIETKTKNKTETIFIYKFLRKHITSAVFDSMTYFTIWKWNEPKVKCKYVAKQINNFHHLNCAYFFFVTNKNRNIERNKTIISIVISATGITKYQIAVVPKQLRIVKVLLKRKREREHNTKTHT